MLLMKDIQKTTTGYKVTYVTNENETRSVDYNSDELSKMEALLKQARLSTGDPATRPDSPEVTDINARLTAMRKEISDTALNGVEKVREDFTALERLVKDTLDVRNELWTKVHKESERRLQILLDSLDKIKFVEENSMATVLNGEKARNEMIDQIKNRTAITWNEIKKAGAAIETDHKSLADLKSKVVSDIDAIMASKRIKEDEAARRIDVLSAKMDETIQFALAKVKQMTDSVTGRVDALNKRFEEEHDLILKKTFLEQEAAAAEVKARQKHKTIMDETAKGIAKLESEAALLREQIGKAKKKADESKAEFVSQIEALHSLLNDTVEGLTEASADAVKSNKLQANEARDSLKKKIDDTIVMIQKDIMASAQKEQLEKKVSEQRTLLTVLKDLPKALKLKFRQYRDQYQASKLK